MEAGARPPRGARGAATAPVGDGRRGAAAGACWSGVGAGVGAHLLAAAPARRRRCSSPLGARRRGDLGGRARPAPAINTLRDQTGHLFSLASLHGRTVAIEFFDSHCNQECPLAGRALAAAERSLPRAQRPVLVVVSVNPLDTPASTRRRDPALGAAWRRPVALADGHARSSSRRYGGHTTSRRARPDGDIAHTEALYLIDRRGDERSGYLYPYIPVRVAHDMRVLAATARAGGVVRARRGTAGRGGGRPSAGRAGRCATT